MLRAHCGRHVYQVSWCLGDGDGVTCSLKPVRCSVPNWEDYSGVSDKCGVCKMLMVGTCFCSAPFILLISSAHRYCAPGHLR